MGRAVKTICSLPLSTRTEKEERKEEKKVKEWAGGARREKPSSLTTSCAESERVVPSAEGERSGPFAGEEIESDTSSASKQSYTDFAGRHQFGAK